MNTIAHAGVAAASAVAAPPDPDDRHAAELSERIDKLARKVERTRLDLEAAELALAEAIAEQEGD
jgi:hypothetical protein